MVVWEHENARQMDPAPRAGVYQSASSASTTGPGANVLQGPLDKRAATGQNQLPRTRVASDLQPTPYVERHTGEEPAFVPDGLSRRSPAVVPHKQTGHRRS